MIPDFLKEKEPALSRPPARSRGLRFVDRTARNMASFVLTSMRQWNTSRKNGLLQQFDPRVKVVVVLAYIVLVSLTHAALVQLSLSALVLLMFALSKINLASVYARIAGFAFVFGVLVFLPATLNVFAPGEVVVSILRFQRERQWLVYHIPQEIGITREGIRMVAGLGLKVFNSISLTFLLASTTSFEQIVKALRIMRTPEVFLLTLTLTYQYIFIFSQTILETYQALRMRWWERGSRAGANAILSGRMGYLFRKSWEKYEDVYQAMLARGFAGGVKLHYEKSLQTGDRVFLLISLAVLAALLYANRYV